MPRTVQCPGVQDRARRIHERKDQLVRLETFCWSDSHYEKLTIPPNRTFIDFSDNQPCIDIIEGRLGILSLLDEESRLPSGSDPSFAQKLYSNLAKPENAKVFKKPRFGTSAFTVSHYALDVTYETDGFLEKNRDTVPDEHLALLSSTSNTFLKEVLDKALALSQSTKAEHSGAETVNKRSSVIEPAANKRSSVIGSANGRKVGATAKKPTLGLIFKLSLISLMETIGTTNAHYIRCIKPNEAKQAWAFEPQMVLSQLRACGVLETIRISTAGYPTRWTFEEFAER
jgi:myosin-5